MFKYLFLITGAVCASPVDIEAEEQFLLDMKEFAVTVDRQNSQYPVVSAVAKFSAEKLHELIEAHATVISVAREWRNVQIEIEKLNQLRRQISSRIPRLIKLLENVADSTTPALLATIESFDGDDVGQFFRISLSGTDGNIATLIAGDVGLLLCRKVVASLYRLAEMKSSEVKEVTKSVVEGAAATLLAELGLQMDSLIGKLGSIAVGLEQAQAQRRLANLKYGESLAFLELSI